MPFTGGLSPSPERYGGGDGSTDAPLLQRVFESLCRARGKPFSAAIGTVVGAENMALARAITFDLYGANTRAALQLNPGSATVDGLLPRWERILAKPPNYGDTQPVRQARCAAAMGAWGTPGTTQPIVDQLKQLLGPIYVGLTLFGPSNALVWWPGAIGSTAYISSASGPLVTVAGLSNVPTAAPGAVLTLTNTDNRANEGVFPVQSWISSSSVVLRNDFTTPVAPDYGQGGSSGSPTIQWSLINPRTPWYSTIAHIDIEVTQNVTGYQNADGSPNAAFYALVQQIHPVLDEMLAAHCTWDWYVLGSGGASGFILDQPNLDLLTFDS